MAKKPSLGADALLLCSAAVAALASAPARAADTVWDNSSADGQWITAANWDTNAVPTVADDVFINSLVGGPFVSAGNNVAAALVFVGRGAGADGNLVVGGPGSALTSNNGLYIGRLSGTGIVLVTAGGSLIASGETALGGGPGSSGALTVTGAGTSYSSDTIAVGDDGDGEFAVALGAAAATAGGSIATLAGGTGSVFVTGAGSLWNNAGGLLVGDGGVGSLSIGFGGAVNSAIARIGAQAGSIGAVTVDGPGSSWNNSTGPLFIGDDGAGALNIADGGEVRNTAGNVGWSAGSSGTVMVDGAGSLWDNSGNLSIGLEGAGELTVSNGGEARNVMGVIANLSGSISTATVDGSGSQWINSGNLTVGNLGNATLSIVNGGDVANDHGFIGNSIGGLGAATVDGAGSGWANAGVLTVGNFGSASLDIENGGGVSSAGGVIGDTAFGQGVARVSGAESSWLSSDTLTVGDEGVGSLLIFAGGEVRNTDGIVGDNPGGIGGVAVGGAGSSWINTGAVVVGAAGTGTMDVASGGKVSNTFGIVGGLAASVGAVTVTDAGVWNNSGDVIVGLSGAGALTIADGGVVDVNSGAGAVDVANGAGSVGTINIGSGAADAAQAAGALNAAALQFGAGVGTLVLNHTDSAYAFTPAISGNGVIAHEAGETILAADSSGFTGSTDVSGGALFIMGVLGGSVFVNGGALGGNGALAGALFVNNGGALAPGNSIGALNAASALFNAGSAYIVELNDGGFIAGSNNDLLNVAGAATVNGGAVHVTPENGADDGAAYPLGQYTILTAGGGVIGTFDTLTDDYAFLNFELSYDANNVYLISSLIDLCLAEFTFNQCATANALETLGSGALVTAVLNLSNAEAAAALNLLSGEIHASAKTALLDDSRFSREAVLSRLGGASGQAEKRIAEGFAFWGEGFGSWSRRHGDANAADLDRKIGGLVMGGDALVTDKVRIGAMGGYSHFSLDVDARASAATAESYTLGAYAGARSGPYALKGGLAHSWHSLDVSRSVALPGFLDSLSAEYDARTLQIYGEAAFDINLASNRLTPFFNLAYVRLNTDSYAETGGVAALTAAKSSAGAAFATLGFRGGRQIDFGEMDGAVSLGIGWRHSLGEVAPAATHALTGGAAFTIAGVPPNKDALTLDAGFDVNLSAMATLTFSYNGQAGSGASDHGARASFALRF